MRKFGSIFFIVVLLGSLYVLKVQNEQTKAKPANNILDNSDRSTNLMKVKMIEDHFQKSLQLSKQGKKASAKKEMITLLAISPADIPAKYFKETYSETNFNLAMHYLQEKNYPIAHEYIEKALMIKSDHARANYYNAFLMLAVNKPKLARQYYDKAKSLGFTGEKEDFIGELLNVTNERRFTINYPRYYEPEKIITISIRGNPVGDMELMTDVLNGIEKMFIIPQGRAMFRQAKIEIVDVQNNSKLITELWTTVNLGEQVKYKVIYNLEPPENFPYAVQLTISEAK